RGGRWPLHPASDDVIWGQGPPHPITSTVPTRRPLRWGRRRSGWPGSPGIAAARRAAAQPAPRDVAPAPPPPPGGLPPRRPRPEGRAARGPAAPAPAATG